MSRYVIRQQPEKKKHMEIDRKYIYGRIRGYSMYPALKPDSDIAVIELLTGEPVRLKKGDIILYEARGKRILHRIIQLRESAYLVSGDHNISTEIVMPDQIIGVLKTVIRNGIKRDSDGIYEKMYRFFWRRCVRWMGRLKHVGQRNSEQNDYGDSSGE